MSGNARKKYHEAGEKSIGELHKNKRCSPKKN